MESFQVCSRCGSLNIEKQNSDNSSFCNDCNDITIVVNQKEFVRLSNLIGKIVLYKGDFKLLKKPSHCLITSLNLFKKDQIRFNLQIINYNNIIVCRETDIEDFSIKRFEELNLLFKYEKTQKEYMDLRVKLFEQKQPI